MIEDQGIDYNFQESNNPFEIAQDLNEEAMIIEKEEEEDNDFQNIDPKLFMNEDGEAHILPWTESSQTDFGLQNSITPELMNELLTQKE